jgi:hypothetical protein
MKWSCDGSLANKMPWFCFCLQMLLRNHFIPHGHLVVDLFNGQIQTQFFGSKYFLLIYQLHCDAPVTHQF